MMDKVKKMNGALSLHFSFLWEFHFQNSLMLVSYDQG